MKCLIFDCDGVILESEDLHRRAYNASFEQFEVKNDGQLVQWSSEFYDELQNKELRAPPQERSTAVGGGKPKMRHYFGERGWPSSKVHGGVASSEADFEDMVDQLQDWKSQNYRDLIAGGTVTARPGVLRLMDEALHAGLKLAVCSAATKESVVFTLTNLLGQERFDSLDCFLAGDDVPKKKPDPIIYTKAAGALGVEPAECVVVEDSQIGVDAAIGAGMRCIVTYTSSSQSQSFAGAEKVMAELGEAPDKLSVQDLMQGEVSGDDRS